MVAVRIPLSLLDEPQARAAAAPAFALQVADGASRQRAGRRDALPEHTRYTDNGCAVHHSCLTCPLERCRYDEPNGARGLRSQERDRTILALQSEGRPIASIAERFGVSRRTVFRVLAASRAKEQGTRNRGHAGKRPAS
jgi:hypothetical protein